MTESEEDIQNIDKTFTREVPRETPEDDMLAQKAKFDHFTYVEQDKFLSLDIDI